jgi:putative restriction endonuclease
MDTDMMIRTKAFDWLAGQVDVHGDVLPRTLLQAGFEFQGQRVPLISPQGIFKPKIMELPLSITTSFTSPYGDEYGTEGFLHYRYRGTNPDHRDNVGLRKVFVRVPLRSLPEQRRIVAYLDSLHALGHPNRARWPRR